MSGSLCHWSDDHETRVTVLEVLSTLEHTRASPGPVSLRVSVCYQCYQRSSTQPPAPAAAALSSPVLVSHLSWPDTDHHQLQVPVSPGQDTLPGGSSSCGAGLGSNTPDTDLT